MKKNILIIKIYILCIFLMSCSESLLDKTALDKYSDGTVWADVDLADAVLGDCYTNTSHGFKGYLMLSAVTDEVYNKHLRGYVDGNLTADEVWAYWERVNSKSLYHVGWRNYKNIQRINYFLDNIDKVPEAYIGEEKKLVTERTKIMKGEALFLRAYLYTRMCRTYGGLPILTKASEINDDFSTVIRSSFKETVEFIVSDCNEAAEVLLVKSNMELGRATKEAALSLKSRILLFAASDLTADGDVQNELVGYLSPDREALWSAAKDAALEVIEWGTCKLADFGAPDQDEVAKNYFNFFKATDLLDDEIIWGKMFLSNIGNRHRMNLWMGPNGQYNWSSANVTQDFVDDYEMKDGSKFYDHFYLDPDSMYVNNSSTFIDNNIYNNREPRLYASILFDGAKFQQRIESLIEFDPIGIYDRRTIETINEDGSVTRRFGLDTRQGPIQEWSGSFTGYVMKKMLDDEVVGKDEYNTNVWIEFRYAEIILNYAEACMELGEVEEATEYINMIRNRAGLPNFTDDIREALQHERQIELAFEDKRWYDIRRWKILEQKLTPVGAITIIEIRNRIEMDTSITWQRFTAFDRGPIPKKLYWLPISTTELNKAPQLEQNPGY